MVFVHVVGHAELANYNCGNFYINLLNMRSNIMNIRYMHVQLIFHMFHHDHNHDHDCGPMNAIMPVERNL